MFGCALLCVHSVIILIGKRKLVALLLSSLCIAIVVWLFLTVPRDCLQFVIVVFPDVTHLLFCRTKTNFVTVLLGIWLFIDT